LRPAKLVELPVDVPLNEAVDDYKRRLILARPKHFEGNKAATARSIGIDCDNFVRQLQRMHIS
jgi:DNA-binding NtrC family response regulator